MTGTLLKTFDQNFVQDLTFLSVLGLDKEEISALRKDKRSMEQATNQTKPLPLLIKPLSLLLE
jgi:hypothetical protein